MAGSEESGSFVRHARRRVREHARQRRQAGHTDKVYAVVQSGAGGLHDGIAFETSMAQFDCCAERHAINNMLYAEPETARLQAILVATPVPDEATSPPTPCGACRHAIDQFSDDGTVYCATFVRRDDGWTMFPRLDRYAASELYPEHQGPPAWD